MNKSQRKALFEAFRGFQMLFEETRERALKAVAFGKLLRKDLEVCAELSLVGHPQQLLGRLHETEYTQVIFW